jgi:hypothetical protein
MLERSHGRDSIATESHSGGATPDGMARVGVTSLLGTRRLD